MRYPLLRRIIDNYKTWKLYKYYSKRNPGAGNSEPWLIYMADGRMLHGGLSDRLSGIISAYTYCKKHNLVFKINFISPYALDDILIPHMYDWRISPEELSYNSNDSIPLYLSVYSFNPKAVNHYFERKLGDLHKKQIHLYTNARLFQENDFHILFSELFKPVPRLERIIKDNLKSLPAHYISITFRFQQLIGDFKEDGFPVLKSEYEKNRLIEKCISCVKQLHDDTQKTILVTSDSKTFLEKVSALDYVYVVPGKIRHLDYNREKDVDIAVDMKSFVDLYLLANSEHLYLYSAKPLYDSGFPKTASFILNRPFSNLK